MLYTTFFSNTHETHLNYHLITAEPCFIHKMVNCMHLTRKMGQNGSIASSRLSHTCSVFTKSCCLLCEKWQFFFVNTGGKVNELLLGYHTISTSISYYKARQMTTLSFSKTVNRHIGCATQWNCCSNKLST